MTRRADTESLAGRVRALGEAVPLTRGRVDDEVIGQAARVIEQTGERLALSGNATVVALAGATGSGKSSTFNAISGTDLAVVGVRRPTTSRALATSWGADSAEELLDWLKIPRRHAVAADAREAAALEGLVLLDLPDHDSTEAAHRLEVDRLVQLVDLLVWVVDPQKYADAALHDRYLKPLADHAEVMMVVLNQADRLTPAECRHCLADLRRLLASEGLDRVEVLAVSAATGQGIAELRKKLGTRVSEKKAAARRLSADVSRAADHLREASGTKPAGTLERRSVQQLNRALGEAAGTPVVAEAVGKAWRLRGGLATGWPALAWLAKFKPDPLRRLHLDRLQLNRRGSGRKQREIDPSHLGRTSLPSTTGVQRARVDSALRLLSDEAGDGLTRGWTTAVKAAARSAEQVLGDQLDQAVASTDLEMARHRRWWAFVRVLQWLLVAAVCVGLAWLAVDFVLAYLRMPPLPEAWSFRGIGLPTQLVIGGVLAGLLLAGVSRIGIEIGARRRVTHARQALQKSIAQVSRELVVGPVNAELERYERARELLDLASG